MSKKIENTPSPDILMNSMRSIGYSFKTALADIIDNSISAHCKNIYIYTSVNEDDPFVSILDDGDGMNDDELLNAMKYGSDHKNYTSKDLGRFGLGLKSASLSQCRVLTVASKLNNKIRAYSWDLDYVEKSKKWECLELEDKEIKKLPCIEKLDELKHGTLVVWQEFDTAAKKTGGSINEYIIDETDNAISHIQLVFHRFLNRNQNRLNIFVNDDKLIGLEPFLEEHPKTDTKKASELSYEGSIIKVQPYILPHQNDLSDEDFVMLGGVDALKDGQGFYIYRNDRLIIYGTWFRLSASTISPELLKYGRIKVDIPNSVDELWEIDIKKQSTVVPKVILNQLRKAVSSVCGRSKEKTAKRTKLTLEKDDSKIWNKSLNRNEKEVFNINANSFFVKNFIDDFSDKEKAKILRFIEIISSTVPVDDIYNSICNRKNELNPSDDIIDSIVLEGVAQVKKLKSLTQKTTKYCFDKICQFEPYNQEEISNKIWSVVKNEK